MGKGGGRCRGETKLRTWNEKRDTRNIFPLKISGGETRKWGKDQALGSLGEQ